jgi:hypothetical protein
MSQSGKQRLQKLGAAWWRFRVITSEWRGRMMVTAAGGFPAAVSLRAVIRNGQAPKDARVMGGD